MSLSRGEKSAHEETDVATAWQEALLKYHEECGTDLRTLPTSRLNITHVKAEQEHQLRLFSQYRHDKGKIDKLRSLVSENADIVIGVATHIADAASAAFPPSAAILTAFNYVMNASRAVSEDYDMIVSFFDIMNSFLERISMLESRMPDEWQFRRFLVNVFSAMMTLSAIARKCRLKGRLNRWAKALIDGSDPKLKGAFDSLHTHLERFESAAMLTTLKHTLESGRKLDFLGQDVRQIRISVEESKIYAEDAASTSHDIFTVVTRQDERGAEHTAGLHQVIKTLDKLSYNRDSQKELVDAGSRRSIAMRTLQSGLRYKFNEEASFNNIENHHVHGTYSWFRTQDIYNKFRAGKVRLLWLTGPAGMGKSTLTYTIVKALQDDFVGDTNTSIAHFFFHEHSSSKYVALMLRSCSLQIASQDHNYREEAVADVNAHEKLSRNRLKERHLVANPTKLWELLFKTKFTKDSGRRLVLILDGVDEVVAEDLRHIETILKDISSPDLVNIQVLIVSDPSSATPVPRGTVHVFELTKDLIIPDIRAIVIARLIKLNRVTTLTQQTKKRIVTRISKHADTMRYVDHMLRMIDQLWRSETAIIRQLNNLPTSTRALYQNILDECHKSHTEQELITLKSLFAWLSYTFQPLHLGCARIIVSHINTGNRTCIDIDEELEDRCGRILQLSDNGSPFDWGDDDEDLDGIEWNADLSDDDEPVGGGSHDIGDFYKIIAFQDKGLRSYFRLLETLEGDRLRTPTSSGHTIILQICQSILCTPATTEDIMNPANHGQTMLQGDAARDWTRHLQAINPTEISEEEIACVVESIYNILSNKGDSIRKIESLARSPIETGPPCVLGNTDEEIHEVLDCIQNWAVRAAGVSPSLLSGTTAAWMRPIARDANMVFAKLADAHVTNWLTSNGHLHDKFVDSCFLFAHYALYRGRDLPVVQQNKQLRTYFMKRATRGNLTSVAITEESFIAVAKALPYIDMAAHCYLSVAISMQWRGLRESSLRQLNLAIQHARTDIERMEIYMRMSQTFFGMIDSDTQDGEYIEPGAGHAAGSDEENAHPADTKVKKLLQRRNRWAKGAVEAATKASEITLSLSEKAIQDSKAQHIADAVWMSKAKAEIMIGDTSNTVANVLQAIRILPDDEGIDRIDILPLLAKAKDWATLVEVQKTLSGTSWISSALCLERYTNEIHNAAKATGKIEFIHSQYQYILPEAEFNGANSSRLMVNWARFYTDVISTPDATKTAKALLNRAVDSKGSSYYSTASFNLSDMLLEQFRGSTRSDKKMAAYREMQDLTKRVSESMGADFDSSQSQTAIPLAHMARKMNAFEFHQGLERTFEGCVAALTDDAGWNDTLSLRMLAKVLALIGLETEAQVAATCQIYILDMEIFKRENDGKTIHPDNGHEVEEIEGEETVDDDDHVEEMNRLALDDRVSLDSCTGDQGRKQIEDVSEKSSIDEPYSDQDVPDGDLNWDTGVVTCSDCSKRTTQWSMGPVYLCFYCTEVDLCQICFDKRAERLAGKPSDEWRRICPQGHRHIKMPIEGWKGLTGGVIRIQDTEVPFQDWLTEVKEKKWPDTWKKFWSDEWR